MSIPSIKFPFNSREIKKLQKIIIKWFLANKRDLPWRKNRTPYRVWIAEIMLQQTQVATVIPYYERWIKKFPTLKKCAETSKKEIIKHWAGLGYYTRVHNIHKTAKIITNDMGGKFPEKRSTLLSLPGIGPYTAGAVGSLAFGKKEPILDGNVERLLIRLSNCQMSTKDKKTKDFLWEMAKKILPNTCNQLNQPGLFNEGMIEIGATICNSGYPSCSLCPLSNLCLSFREGSPETLPKGKKKIKILDKYVSTFVIESNGEFLLHKRTNKGLMAGFWEFPLIEHQNKRERLKFLQKGLVILDDSYFFSAEESWKFKHFYTRFQIHVCVIKIKLNKQKEKKRNMIPSDIKIKPFHVFAWKTADQIKQIAFTSANMKIREKYFSEVFFNNKSHFK